jgi:hypothetical protein
MEAAVWTANRCAEIIALDKLGKAHTLNVDWKPRKGLTPFMKPAFLGGGALAVLALARRSRKP